MEILPLIQSCKSMVEFFDVVRGNSTIDSVMRKSMVEFFDVAHGNSTIDSGPCKSMVEFENIVGHL